MQARRCVILEHSHHGGRHFDWLFEHPAWPVGAAAPLWAGRIARPPRCWPGSTARLLVQPLAAHRRRYLDYQGPLSRDRGVVRRVDRGWVTALLWRESRAVLRLDLAGWRGRVELRALPGGFRTARCEPA
jgi:hypothetical protein